MAIQAEYSERCEKTYRRQMLTAVVGIGLLPVVSFPAMLIGLTLGHGYSRYLITALAILVINAPAGAVALRVNVSRQRANDVRLRDLADQLEKAVRSADEQAVRRERQVKHQEFERRLANALDMAETETEVVEVIERSFATITGDTPAELLLADNSHAHLVRMVTSQSADVHPGCGVDSPDRCPAARRAQVQKWGDSDDLDACPKLRSRPQGRTSAVCVPVSIMGRTVGVIHATGEPGNPAGDGTVQDLGILAKLAGARLGLLRVMAETQLQASTDSLTGLLNRRSFDEKVAVMRRSHPAMAVAMADLDHFKQLNDTYGHDTGDRALRLFSQVARESVRARDVLSRRGGEEFAFAFPACTAQTAHERLDALRERLSVAVAMAGLPGFTVSFGVAELGDDDDLTAVLARADSALFQAKLSGRDRVQVFGDGAAVSPPAPPPVPAQ